MRMLGDRRSWLGALCAALGSLALAGRVQAAHDPLSIFTPAPPPPPAPVARPPTGNLYGPCGLAVDSSGRFYVSDYYHHAVDIFNPSLPAVSYVAQLANEDPLNGPCGLALDSSNRLYVNNFHKDVVRFNALPSFGAGTVFPLPVEDAAHHLPTGIAVDPGSGYVYVNHRTYISVFDSTGAPVEESGQPVLIGKGSLQDGYGVAVSQFPATLGRIYVPDAGSSTVKVYDPLVDKDDPVAVIKDPFNKPFVSLRDSAIAVDKASGEIYFADHLQPNFVERPQASIYVYGPTGNYKGRLKYNVIDALPPGLTVDNSAQPTQGRVYVTSGNTTSATVYIYGPGSATTATPLPPFNSGLQPPGSSSATSDGGTLGGAALAQSPETGATEAPQASIVTTSTITQEENLRVNVDGRLAPRKLPRKGAAPISVQVGWSITTTDGTPPPKLKGLRIEINRHGRFDTTGLPTCPYTKIQPATTQRALANCRAALVGRGSFSAEIALKGQEGESYEARGQLLVFNGEVKGKPVLFGQIYSPRPFATSFVIPFEVAELGKGAYGTVLSATLPKTC